MTGGAAINKKPSRIVNWLPLLTTSRPLVIDHTGPCSSMLMNMVGLWLYFLCFPVHFCITLTSLVHHLSSVVFISNKSETRTLPELMKDYEGFHSVAITSVPFGTSHHVWNPPGLVTSNFQFRTALLFDQLHQLEELPITNDQYYSEMFKLKSIVRTQFAREGYCGAHLFSDTRLADPKASRTVLFDKKPLIGCGSDLSPFSRIAEPKSHHLSCPYHHNFFLPNLVFSSFFFFLQLRSFPLVSSILAAEFFLLHLSFLLPGLCLVSPCSPFLFGWVFLEVSFLFSWVVVFFFRPKLFRVCLLVSFRFGVHPPSSSSLFIITHHHHLHSLLSFFLTSSRSPTSFSPTFVLSDLPNLFSSSFFRDFFVFFF